jgi:hypothetical protein
MAHIADLYFPPPIEDNDSILFSFFSASYIHSAEAHWRQEAFHFISENIGVIAQPSPTSQEQMRQFELLRFPPPAPLIQPPPPRLSRWMPRAIDYRLNSFRFIHS